MRRMTLLFLCAVLLTPLSALGQDVVVTRAFTGLWDQVDHESQGINLQIVDQADGSKVGVAYWFTYGDDRSSAWFFGVGPVSGNRIDMILYEGDDIGFLEDDTPGNDDRIRDVGTLEMVFSTCHDAVVTFVTDVPEVGSGAFDAQRFTDLFNTSCSGGVSDDTPVTVIPSEQRIALAPAREGVVGSGHADFEERADRTEFSVEVEDVPLGTYSLFVGGDLVGTIEVVTLTDGRVEGEIEFRSPVETGKVLLTFDPRGMLIEVHDAQGAILTSGDNSFDGGDDNGGDDNGGDDNGGDDNGGDDNGGDDNGGDLDWGTVEIDVELSNTGVYPAASGDAKLEPRDDRTDFSVEIEDVPVGTYTLNVGGETVGTIEVTQLQDGSVEGEIEFRNPVEPGKVLLDFDPRGKQIDVLEGQTVVLETSFPQ